MTGEICACLDHFVRIITENPVYVEMLNDTSTIENFYSTVECESLTQHRAHRLRRQPPRMGRGPLLAEPGKRLRVGRRRAGGDFTDWRAEETAASPLMVETYRTILPTNLDRPEAVPIPGAPLPNRIEAAIPQ